MLTWTSRPDVLGLLQSLLFRFSCRFLLLLLLSELPNEVPSKLYDISAPVEILSAIEQEILGHVRFPKSHMVVTISARM